MTLLQQPPPLSYCSRSKEHRVACMVPTLLNPAQQCSEVEKAGPKVNQAASWPNEDFNPRLPALTLKFASLELLASKQQCNYVLLTKHERESKLVLC